MTDNNRLDDSKKYYGVNEEICSEDMRNALMDCGMSDEMINHLISNKSISVYQLTDIICRAPISLGEKIHLLHEFSSYNIQYINDLYEELSEAFSEMVSPEALDERILYVFSEWYDTEDHMLKSSPCGMFTSLERLNNYINNEHEDDEGEGDIYEGYYRIELWDINDEEWKELQYVFYSEYIRLNVCWYEINKPVAQDNGNTYYLSDNRKFAAGEHDLNLSTPYKPGDIVLIDCRPFGPSFHAMILEARDQFDCCFPNIVFNVHGTDEWSLTPLKHRRFYKDIGFVTYEPLLSPLYRLRKVKEEEYTKEDEKLLELSKIINGSEEKAMEVWNRWGCENRSWTDVAEVFDI